MMSDKLPFINLEQQNSVQSSGQSPEMENKLLTSDLSAPAAETPLAGLYYLLCARCHNLFLLSSVDKYWVRCPHCKKTSTAHPSRARYHGVVSIVLAVFLTIKTIAIINLSSDFAEENPGIFAVYALLIVLTILFFIRAIVCFTLKTSTILKEPV